MDLSITTIEPNDPLVGFVSIEYVSESRSESDPFSMISIGVLSKVYVFISDEIGFVLSVVVLISFDIHDSSLLES